MKKLFWKLYASLNALLYSKEIDFRHIKNILLIRLDGIGDFIYTIPSLKAVREFFPNSRIILLSSSVLKDLLFTCPYIDDFVIYDYLESGFPRKLSREEKKGIKNILKPYNIDLAIDFRFDGITTIFTYLSGTKYRVGYYHFRTAYMLTHRVYLKDKNRHLIDLYSEVPESIGIKVKDRKLELWENETDRENIEKFLNDIGVRKEDLIVGLHPGASLKQKQWDAERFAEVGNYLIEKYKAKVFITGSKNEEELVKKVNNLMRNKGIEIAGEFNLSQIVSLLKKYKLLITNETGISRIGLGVNVPVIEIQTGNAPREWTRQKDNPNYFVLRKDVECAPCGIKLLGCQNRKCINEIKVEEVIEIVRRILS